MKWRWNELLSKVFCVTTLWGDLEIEGTDCGERQQQDESPCGVLTLGVDGSWWLKGCWWIYEDRVMMGRWRGAQDSNMNELKAERDADRAAVRRLVDDKGVPLCYCINGMWWKLLVSQMKAPGRAENHKCACAMSAGWRRIHFRRKHTKRIVFLTEILL